ncbi:CPS_collapsed_G0017000.mRNA.1.CDS.1 [Saccharomyces cerevisiae]|nr:CPS_collapsed_G0017000.mRNA.1.CDS.1 [Saccharomyces cerevisiae]
MIQGPKLTKKVYRYVMYCILTFANPSGNTYCLRPDADLSTSLGKVQRPSGEDPFGNTVSNVTFSADAPGSDLDYRVNQRESRQTAI